MTPAPTTPLGTQYLFTLERELDVLDVLRVQEIPGARCKTVSRWVRGERVPVTTIRVAAHGGWLVADLLGGEPHRIKTLKHSAWAPETPEAAEAALLASELRPGIWSGSAERAYLPFQRQRILRVVQAGSGAYWWPPGSGKTPAAIAWAVAPPFSARHPRAILTVTKAAVRRQWAREIERWTTLRPWVSDPGFRRQARWRDPQDYWTACWMAGTRPWYVVGWEELATLVFGDKAHVEEGSLEDRKELAPEAEPEERARTAAALSRVRGVGPALAERIIQHFGRLEELQAYGLTQGAAALRKHLLRVHGVGPVVAAAVLEVYHLVRADPPSAALAACLPSIPLESVIFDEVHLASNRRRRKFLVGAQGAQATLEALSRRNRVAAAEVISRQARRRLGTTATPIPNRVRDLWGQLDLIDPWGWGGYWIWAKRFAAAHQGDFGMLDDGASHLEELTCRLGLTDIAGTPYVDDAGGWHGEPSPWAFISQVPKAVSHRELPPMRREVRRLDPLLLTRGDSAAARAVHQAEDDETRLERALAWASTCKRGIVVEEVVAAVLAGSKVLVLSGRHDDVERTFAAIKSKLRKGWSAKLKAQGAAALGEEDRVPGLWWTHGGDAGGEDKRDLVVRAYMGWDPARGAVAATRYQFADAEAAAWADTGAPPVPDLGCCLVATGQYLGTGLDLHDTDLLIVSMLPLTPEQLEQWEGRVQRHGQFRPVLILYYVAEGTVDEHVATLLVDKLPAVGKVTGQVAMAQVADDIEGLGDPEAVLAGILARFRSGGLGSADLEDDGD